MPNDEDLGTDGLYFQDRTLIAIKPRLERISRLYLNEQLSRVTRVETLADSHPDFVYPTTGVVVADKLVFVATSYADSPRKPGETRQHADILIDEIELR